MVETNGGSSLENVPGFDAARARNAGLVPRTTAPCAASAGPNGFVRENIIGDDNLVPVPDTTGLPWRCIAMLTITYEDGSRGTGTAWFMGERALGTAGHNIRDPEHGRATEILVSPAFDGSIAPFGTYRVSQTYCDPAWLNGGGDPSLDFGVLMLEDRAVGRRLGWFGFAAYNDRQLNRLLLNVSGYPARRPSNRTQHYNGGRVDDVDRKFLRYTFDTVGGMSGAPIFALFGEQRVAVGIHTSGNDRANRARRIDSALYEVLNRFAAA
jgi:V8-like Glu-specific endopeptidase